MSSRDKRYDVIIMGAGLAGLSAARAVARGGKLSAAIIDYRFPGARDPSPLTYVDAIERFGLDDCIKESYSVFCFHNPHGSSVTYRFRRDVLAVLDYRRACEKIFTGIKKDGVSFLKGRVTGVNEDQDGVTVRMNGGSVLYASVAIDATGNAMLTAGSSPQGKKTYYSHVYGALFTGAENPRNKTCCYLLPEPGLGTGGGWYYSLGASDASFGYAQISESPVLDTGFMKERFERACASVEPYAGYLAGARIRHYETGVIPITYAEKMAGGRMIVTGDAAGIATSWTCMGVEPALLYGSRAGEAAASFASGVSRSAIESYRDGWLSENRETFDAVAANAHWFWSAGRDFWEWVVKNDLARLEPEQVIGRMRYNEHLLGKPEILFRMATHRIKSMLFRAYTRPKDFLKGS